MISDAELIVDRRKMKRKLTAWRITAIVLFIGAILALISAGGGFGDFKKTYEDHIARVRIDGFISGDQSTLDLFDDIAESNKVKGVIIRIDSPGGSTAGSEALYDVIRKVAKDKPVVAVMDTVAASGGYITAIAADYIVARGNTITGSIGVIFQFPEVSKLLETLGVKVEEIKSGELKAEPNPYKPVTDKARAVANIMVQDSFSWFTGLVADRRKLPLNQVLVLSDGRVYTGRQAVKEKLVDILGGEEKAVDWLTTEKKLSKDLKILDWKPSSNEDISSFGVSAVRLILSAFGLERLVSIAEQRNLDGLLAVWQPHL
jgi:protease-4